MQAKVLFHSITKPAEKITTLIRIVHESFKKKDSLHIIVDSEKAASFIDSLLWSTPSDSFIPHGPKELITIGNTTIPDDVFHVLNTTKTPLNDPKQYFTTLYEFEEKNTEGEKIFMKKFHYYTQRGFTVISSE